MRTLDLDMVRPQIAEFTLGGKIFKVMECSLGQRIMHRLEADRAQADLEAIRRKGGKDVAKKYEECLNAWLHREVQIFIPEYTKEDSLNASPTQRSKILNLIFEVDDEAEEQKNLETAKKKQVPRGQRGEK